MWSVVGKFLGRNVIIGQVGQQIGNAYVQSNDIIIRHLQ